MDFKFRVAFIMVIVTMQRNFGLAQDPSFYLDPNNNYDNYNNDYSIHAMYGGQRNSLEESSSGTSEEDSSEEQSSSVQPESNGKMLLSAKIPSKSDKKKQDKKKDKKKHDKKKPDEKPPKDSCWLTLNAAGHFKAMDDLDEEYKLVRQNYQQNVGGQMDRQMLDELLSSRGAAPRTVHKFGGKSLQIPAGLNLGGSGMLRLQDSILFFHRMKLRNQTHFQVNYLHNDLENMALIGRIGLNDLHLVGAYERSATHKDPSVLYYRPSYGTVELLLKNVNYAMEARLRMMSDRITIELINSELTINDDILLSYLNTNLTDKPEYTVMMQKRNFEDFLQRLKTDLDLWLKDFFNDFLMYYEIPEYDNTKFQEYEKKKTIFLNEYASYALNTIRQKIYNLVGTNVKLPKFTLFAVPNMILRINDGVLRGLDSMYRRSVATGAKHSEVRVVDVIIGFSRLRAEYKFEAVLPNGSPPLTGHIVLSADEMTAHLGIALVKAPDSVDLKFDFIQQMKPESLSVEGPANRLIANFKHQLEHHIIALISNALMHNIKMLNTITRCVPFIYSRDENKNKGDLRALRRRSKVRDEHGNNKG